MALGTEWCTLDDVKALLATPYPDDADITTAITTATSALTAEFCVTPLDVLPDPGTEDPGDTYPDDWKVRQATAVMASQILTATPPGTDGGMVEQESIGGYSYRTTKPRSTHTATRVDGYVAELVAGYLCPGGANDVPHQTDVMTKDPVDATGWYTP